MSNLILETAVQLSQIIESVPFIEKRV